MIGVFDSGVGGLSILREIRSLLPQERLVYVADSAHLPYGTKSAAFVEQRALAVSEFLLQRGAKALVVACNTATAAAVAGLRSRFPLPIVGVEPALKPAVQATRSGVVGVLATPGTLGSGKFAQLVAAHSGDVQVLLRPCPGWVDHVEQGELDGPATRELVAEQVEPLLEAGADTLVLGCTHFPFLRPVVQSVAGADVEILDTGAAVARELRRRLEALRMAAASETDCNGSKEEIWTSGEPTRAAALVAGLWGAHLPTRALPSTFAGLAPEVCP